MTPPVAIAVQVPGATARVRSIAAGNDFGVERKHLWMAIRRADCVGSPQSKAIDVGPVERRCVDRRCDVMREYAHSGIPEHYGFGPERTEIETLLEARTRFFG